MNTIPFWPILRSRPHKPCGFRKPDEDATASGVHINGCLHQGDFLYGLGLRERARLWRRRQRPDQTLYIAEAINRLEAKALARWESSSRYWPCRAQLSSAPLSSTGLTETGGLGHHCPHSKQKQICRTAIVLRCAHRKTRSESSLKKSATTAKD